MAVFTETAFARVNHQVPAAATANTIRTIHPIPAFLDLSGACDRLMRKELRLGDFEFMMRPWS